MANKVTFVFRLLVYVGRMGTVQLRILILINVKFWLFSCQWFGKELPSQSSQWNVWWTGKFRSFVSINQCNLNTIGSTIYLLIIMMFTTTNKLKREFCALFFRSMRSNQLKELKYGVFDNKGNLTHLWVQEIHPVPSHIS